MEFYTKEKKKYWEKKERKEINKWNQRGSRERK
jgi:hypothetical protein